MTQERLISDLIKRYPALEDIKDEILQAYRQFVSCYEAGGKLLLAGNGGSAADAEHMAGELMKGFKLERPLDAELRGKLLEVDEEIGAELGASLQSTLTAVTLVSHVALSTAYLNDVGSEGLFAQQLLGFGRPGDVLVGISTSGNSRNVLEAAVLAKAIGISVVGLTGKDGGKLKDYADISVCVPEEETFLIQEYHLPIYHCWCRMLEEHFFGRD
ncbi:MAG: SIS domain-containing protein [Eubacterium sp.]|nr:SIS domain-containing protein [Eubacterium sp.]